MRSLYLIFFLIFTLANNLVVLSEETIEPGHFNNVLPNKSLQFPKDHGSHPAYKTEWWYFTGHLVDQQKEYFRI